MAHFCLKFVLINRCVKIATQVGPQNRTMNPVAQLFIDCVRKLARPFAK
jgi:hypothetical protein